MQKSRIAIVGMGLEFPDASTPEELWENVLGGRRAFRDLPDQRTRLDDYWNPDPTVPDAFYSRKAAVLRDYEFDRVAHKVSTGTFTVTDMAHWLALDVAGRALSDAGFAGGEGLPLARTSTVIGNTLTGEFTRASVMRLRWPFVRRSLAAELRRREWSTEDTDEFLGSVEAQYKASFPATTEDSLAGGLANTIAGRICNFFDLGGGGYTVDGACSSSLLAVTTACKDLENGDVDVALAGGVDLSIDPFELTGFAKTGALATREMLVYDEGANGFWPGEGCGMVVLMREQDALEQGHRIYASITGWGVSSDGRGGMTRPEEAGHRRAIDRAYHHAGYGPEEVGYFEGHGTGTAVGDATEIRTLAGTRGADGPAAALGSIKANIGHTKAAAGSAGLIKAALVAWHEIIPPVTGQLTPHPELVAAADRLYTPATALPWPAGRPVRTAVSAMGFGGINTHIALEGNPTPRGDAPDSTVLDLVRGRQDTELILLGAPDDQALLETVDRAVTVLTGAAICELADIAAALSVPSPGDLRVGVVAASVEDAVARLGVVRERLVSGTPSGLEQVAPGAFVGRTDPTARIGLLFPGQGAGHGHAGGVSRRFGTGEALPLPEGTSGTAALQPRVVHRSLETLDALRRLGIDGDVATGHSLGELCALAWSGCFTPEEALSVATSRGRLMAGVQTPGAMAVVRADAETVSELIEGFDAVVSGLNSPSATVVAGRPDAIAQITVEADRRGLRATPLEVTHAFHTADFAEVAPEMAEIVADIDVSEATGRVLSTLSGAPWTAGTDLGDYLARQMVQPVRFVEAVTAMGPCPLLIEVGPGRSLGTLAADIRPDAVVVSTDSDADGLGAFLEALAAAHALGREVDVARLRAGRLLRPVDLDATPQFLTNPCETAPDLDFVPSLLVDPQAAASAQVAEGESTVDVLRRFMADKSGLPIEMITEDTQPLDELHLSSITIGQLVGEVSRALGRPPITGVPSFATAPLGEIARMLDEADASAGADTGETTGASGWVRSFEVVHVPEDLGDVVLASGSSHWRAAGHHDALTTAVLEALEQTSGNPGFLLDSRELTVDGFVEAVDQVLEWLRSSIERAQDFRLLVLQSPTRGGAGLAKSVIQEHPDCPVTVVTVQDGTDVSLAARVMLDVATNRSFLEVRYAADGTRATPRLEPIGYAPDSLALNPSDVLVATGGGKGITAEACLTLAARYGVKVGLLGRAGADDPDVAANLARFEAAGVEHLYLSADVTDPGSAQVALEKIQSALGRVTAVVHGAGVNQPGSAVELTGADFRTAMAPKVQGLENVLAAVDPEHLKLVVGFGSIIGRGGLYGEAHYATANDWLSSDIASLRTEHPHIRAMCLEWSVWSGAGMGERLGVVERLKQRGIEPISTEWGLAELVRLLGSETTPTSVVVCSRTGSIPTLEFARREIPLLRFLDRILVDYPGTELIVEADLSAESDPYLLDHELDGNLVFPAVLGLEAMAQVARALVPGTEQTTFEDIAFERPIVVPRGGTETIRVAAVADHDGRVHVALRSGSNDFAADHFRAVVLTQGRAPNRNHLPQDRRHSVFVPPVALDPQRELYGSVMFQQGRFRQLHAYKVVSARHAVFDVTVGGNARFHASHLPGEMLLGDPGARDAVMHGLQCCVPDAILIPAAVEAVHIDTSPRADIVTVSAVERHQDGDSYVYDLFVQNPDGTVVEAWEGLTVRAVSRRDPTRIEWAAPFLGSYLERAAQGGFGDGTVVIVEPHSRSDRRATGARRAHTATAVARALGGEASIAYRGDGRPQLPDGTNLSSSHTASLTLTAVAPHPVSCDVENVTPREEFVWSDLLGAAAHGAAKQTVAETGEDFDTSATRVWGALETVRKAGHLAGDLHLGEVRPDGWVVYTVGSHPIATWVGVVRGGDRIAICSMKGL